ncbi:MAG: hypothetical protein JOY91_16075, partial [Sinobacteraceae bacterium]|nr:hypothetical protein [Nevskiaceae bacterium]
MRRILLVICALLILAAIAIPAAGFYYFAFTENGLRFLVAHLPHRLGDVQVEISAPAGTLAHGLSIGRLEIDHQLVHLQLTDIRGRVELLPLMLQTIRTDGATIGRLVIQAKHRTRPPTASA